MPPLRSRSGLGLAGKLAMLSVAVAASVPLWAQGFASAAGKVTIEKPVGATVVTSVLDHVSLPGIGPVPSPPATGGGGPTFLPSQGGGVAAPAPGNLITLFSNGDTQLVSDTTISVRIAPGPQGIDGALGSSPGDRRDGPVMVIAQFN